MSCGTSGIGLGRYMTPRLRTQSDGILYVIAWQDKRVFWL